MIDIPKNTIETAALGDMGAFEEIYKTFSPIVYTLALQITRNRQDAEEVTQDVFVKIFRKLKDFRFGSSFGTWAYRIAVNTAMNVYRSRARRQAVTANIDDIGEIPEIRDNGPEGMVRGEEAERNLAGILKYVSAQHRACLILREIEGLDYKEIADTLGIPVNTVRSRLKRAREALMAAVRKGGHSS